MVPIGEPTKNSLIERRSREAEGCSGVGCGQCLGRNALSIGLGFVSAASSFATNTFGLFGASGGFAMTMTTCIAAVGVGAIVFLLMPHGLAHFVVARWRARRTLSGKAHVFLVEAVDFMSSQFDERIARLTSAGNQRLLQVQHLLKQAALVRNRVSTDEAISPEQSSLTEEALRQVELLGLYEKACQSFLNRIAEKQTAFHNRMKDIRARLNCIAAFDELPLPIERDTVQYVALLEYEMHELLESGNSAIAEIAETALPEPQSRIEQKELESRGLLGAAK